VLDNGRFLWTGELWPGQRGALVIEEDEPSRQHGDAPASALPARWRVRLTLDFAHLGAIEASLSLSGDTLDLGLHCDTPEVAVQLRAAAPTLRAAIAERALDLDHVSITDGRAA
jgi:flagellar hook-length control protein FliK